MRISSTRMVATVLMITGLLCTAVRSQTVVTWDGGDDDFAAAKWNGGMTATDVFGDTRISNGSFDITIGDGSTVTYDAPGTGDGLRPRSNTGPTTMTITDGATLVNTTVPAGDADGMWTEWDAGLNLDNGTYKRDWQSGGNAQAGGILMFGSWRSVQDQVININVTNGGKLDNDGQVWFGADEEHALGLKVNMTINNGTVDLTGGAYPTSNDTNVVSADWAIWYGTDQGEGDGSTATGDPKGEKYKIDFKGPGTITVDHSGIWVYDQDSIGIWTDNGGAQTYEYLWDRGILRSQGVSGGFGSNFSDFFTVTGTAGTDDYTLTRKSPTVVTWDGGDGDFAAANWNGGQTAAAVFGDTRISNGSYDITIGSGATVTYDAPGTGDGLRPRDNTGPTSVTIKDGATLVNTTVPAGDADGMWTEWDANLTLDNGTYKRDWQSGGNAQAGGILMFGSWRSLEGQEIEINLTNGGKLQNDGQVWFGADEEHAKNLSIVMTINDGSLDLTGGAYPTSNDTNVVSADWAFWYGTDQGEGNGTVADGSSKNEYYAVNFTGPGSITVDQSGIWVYDQDSIGIWTDNGGAQTYEYLWDRGILQANGLSGLDGAIFGDYFSVTGTAGADDYMLTSLIGGVGLDGDYNNDGKVDAADYVLWRSDPGSYGGAGGYDTCARTSAPPRVAALDWGLVLPCPSLLRRC